MLTIDSTHLDSTEQTAKPNSMYRANSPRLQSAERFLEHVFKFEHGANIFPFTHIVLYYVALAFLTFGVFTSPWLNVPIWIGLLLANYSLSIGIQHMHTHRKLFTSPLMNRITETLLTLPAGVSYPLMKYIHVHLHHRYDDGEGDPTSTKGKESGWHAIAYWILYGPKNTILTAKGIFDKNVKPTWKRLRSQFIIDHTIMLLFAYALYLYDPSAMLWYFLIPYVIVSINIGYFAWLTHAPAREGKLNGSINNTNNWMNFFVHNQGYHSIHHIKPSVHWTVIPDYFIKMKEVDNDLIVPYWVTLESSYRIKNPDSFRNESYGQRWKQRFDKKYRSGTFRSKLLPYFGWV